MILLSLLCGTTGGFSFFLIFFWRSHFNNIIKLSIWFTCWAPCWNFVSLRRIRLDGYLIRRRSGARAMLAREEGRACVTANQLPRQCGWRRSHLIWKLKRLNLCFCLSFQRLISAVQLKFVWLPLPGTYKPSMRWNTPMPVQVYQWRHQSQESH